MSGQGLSRWNCWRKLFWNGFVSMVRCSLTWQKISSRTMGTRNVKIPQVSTRSRWSWITTYLNCCLLMGGPSRSITGTLTSCVCPVLNCTIKGTARKSISNGLTMLKILSKQTQTLVQHSTESGTWSLKENKGRKSSTKSTVSWNKWNLRMPKRLWKY
jgi:hypothetical protein